MFTFRNRLISFYRKYSTASESYNEVLFDVKNDVGIITLNRPKVLNSLNESMVTAIYTKLKEWERLCSFVIVRGAGNKAFCAGGDVVAATRDKNAGKSFFRNEYKMNYLIGKYRIPYISLIDGITMGGGVGISIHGPFRIATERTLFAMPETAIGLFPDVGGSYFLPKLKYNFGLFLGLTGHRLQGSDVVNSGIATHFIWSRDMEKFFETLITIDPYDLSDFLNKETVDVSNVHHCLAGRQEDIECHFNNRTVEDILFVLHKSSGYWEKEIATMIEKNSPVSVTITRAQLEIGSKMDLRECLKMEYRLACAALERKVSSDFYEGVRAQLIDKDKSPKWVPDHVTDVTDEMIHKVFERLPPDEELDI